jgi:hypothetical protein
MNDCKIQSYPVLLGRTLGTSVTITEVLIFDSGCTFSRSSAIRKNRLAYVSSSHGNLNKIVCGPFLKLFASPVNHVVQSAVRWLTWNVLCSRIIYIIVMHTRYIITYIIKVHLGVVLRTRRSSARYINDVFIIIISRLRFIYIYIYILLFIRSIPLDVQTFRPANTAGADLAVYK